MNSDIKPDFEKLALDFTLKYFPKDSCVTDTDVIIQSTLCTGYYNGAKDMYETLEKKVIRLAKALKVAQQMIIGYDMRHPNEKQILNGFTNTEVKELIEKSYEIEHEDPILSTVKRLQEENQQLKEALDHLTANGGFLQAVAASNKNSLLMEWYMKSLALINKSSELNKES